MYGPIGYYVTCDDALCADCAPAGFAESDYSEWEGFDGWSEPIAIFPSTESDTPTHCAECEALIPHDLTPDGLAYVAERLAADDGRPEIHAMWAEAYAVI